MRSTLGSELKTTQLSGGGIGSAGPSTCVWVRTGGSRWAPRSCVRYASGTPSGVTDISE